MANFPSDAIVLVDSTVYNLSSRKPNKGFSTTKRYKNTIFSAQSGHEKRNNVSRRPKRTFSLSYTNVNGGYKTAIEQFYDDRSGELDSFILDLTYLGLVGSVLVRFDGDLEITEVLTTGIIGTSFYNVQFNLTETYN